MPLFNNWKKQKTARLNFALRRAVKPAVPLNLRKIIRHFPGSDKPFAFTQHYGRSLLTPGRLRRCFRSSDSEGMGHTESFFIAFTPTGNSLWNRRSDRLRHSRCLFCSIVERSIHPSNSFVNSFRKIILTIYSNKERSCRPLILTHNMRQLASNVPEPDPIVMVYSSPDTTSGLLSMTTAKESSGA